MRAATLFSGIGAPELAMPHWSWLWHAEIEPFPSAVMAHHHPTSINLGDVLTADFLERAAAEPLDILVGGPPCQAFSVAGLRGGLADPRGNLTLRWVQIIHASRPAFALTENVPGWLNTKDNAFGCFLGALVGADDALAAPPGGGWPSAGMVAGPLQRACWRVLDAQYFGLAQRRQRVFVVSCPADGGDPTEVLFERKGMRVDTSQGEGAGQGIAGSAAWGISADCFDRDGEGANGTAGERSGLGIVAEASPTLRAKRPNAVAYGGNNTAGPIDIATALNAHGGPNGRCDFESETFVAQAFRTSGNCGAWSTGDRVDTLSTGTDPSSHLVQAVAFQDRFRGDDGRGYNRPPPTSVEQIGTLETVKPWHVAQAMSVRRLLPEECEILQGVPQGFTDVPFKGKPAADGNRYRALGNAMAVPVVRWILSRIEAQAHAHAPPDLLRAARQ